MSWIRTAVDQPITVAVGVLLAVIAGLVALDSVAIQMTPDVDDTVIAVTTRWENASPQEVEAEVVDEQEERLQGVTGLVSVTSTSQQSQGQIRLQFATGTSKEVALREVSNKLREVPEYPIGVDEPIIEATDPDSRDYIAWYLVVCDDPDLDIRTLRDFFEERVKPRLERLPGVAAVGVLGGRERETQVRFDPLRLAQRRVTVSDLVTALQATNRDMSAGALERGKLDIRVRTVGRYASIDQILDTVVRQDESGTVYVRDVATAIETYKEPDSFVRASGQPGLAMNFEREPGTNVLEVMAGLEAEIARLQEPGGMLDTYANAKGLEAPIRFVESYDQTDYVFLALELVQENIVLGGLLAIIVLLLFLRSLRAVGIIAVAMPISVLGAIVVMLSLGRSVNVISLAGMAFAVGMVVDNAIVVIENIFRHLEMGKHPRRAALDGTTEVAGAVLASTLTTLIVFVPILLIEETAGQLFRDISLAICAAVGLSFVVSVLVIPSAAALLLRPHRDAVPETERRPRGRLRQRLSALRTRLSFADAIAKLDYRLLGSRVARAAVILVFVAVSIGGTLLLVPPVDYLPKGNRNIVFGMMIPPPGYSLEQMEVLRERVESTIGPFWERSNTPVEELPAFPTSFAPGAPMVVPPILDEYFFVAMRGMLFHGGISTDPKRVIDIMPLFNAATSPQALPGVLSYAFQFPLFRLGGASGSAVKIDVTGEDLGQVSAAAGALYGALSAKYGPYAIQPTPPNFALPAPELQVVPDLVKMSDVGLTVADLGAAVAANSDGVIVGDYRVGDELIDLKLLSSRALATDYVSDLSSVPTATPLGDIVALGDVADFRWVREPEQIRRVGRQRAVTLEFTAPDGTALQTAIDELESTTAELRRTGAIPPGVDVQLAGTAERLRELLNALLGDGSVAGLLRSSLFLALLVVYLLMAVLFQSWVDPLVILFSVPLATFGGFLGLALVHALSEADRYLPVQKLDVLALLGFVILAGVVVNNAILLVAQTRNFLLGAETTDLAPGEEMTPRRAIALSVKTRVRPIFMSMLTSVGGMLPLVLMPGSGSELYRGLGAVVVGGLLISTIFTLVLVPMVLGIVYDLRSSRAARRASGGAA